MWRSSFSTENRNLHTRESLFELWFLEFLHVELDKSEAFPRDFLECGPDWAQLAGSCAVGVGPAGVGLGGVTGVFFERGRSGITLCMSASEKPAAL